MRRCQHPKASSSTSTYIESIIETQIHEDEEESREKKKK